MEYRLPSASTASPVFQFVFELIVPVGAMFGPYILIRAPLSTKKPM